MKTKPLLCLLTLVLMQLTNALFAQNCQAAFALSANNNVVAFTNTSTGGTANTPYYWDFGDGKNSQRTNPTHTYQYNGTYFIYLSMGDSIQCHSTYTDTVVVTGGVNLLCNAMFYSYTDSLSNDSLHSVYFYDASKNPTSWSWNFGDNTSSNLQNPIHQYSQLGVYNVCLTVINAGHDTCIYCDKIRIKTNPSCKAAFTFASNNNVTNFTNTSTGGTSNTFYQWDFGDGQYSTLNNPQHVYKYNGSYTAYLTMTMNDSISFCTSTYYDTVVVTGGINLPCNAMFYSYTDSLSNDSLHSVYFYDASKNPTSWSWNFGDNTSSNLQNPIHQYSQPGVYNVCLTVINAGHDTCTYCDTVRIDTFSINICSTTLQMYKDTLNSNSQTWYLQSTITGKAPFSYLWNFGDGSTSTQQYPTHTYAVPSHYAICLTVTDVTGCVSTTCDSTYRTASPGIIGTLKVLPAVQVSVQEQTISDYAIYPNPASNLMTISFRQVTEGELRILDMTGRVLHSEKIKTDRASIDVSNLPAGFYNLSVVSGANISHNKIMVAR